jgi:hypothetical protein
MFFITAGSVRAAERGSEFVASGGEMSSLELAGNQTKLAAHGGAYLPQSLAAPVRRHRWNSLHTGESLSNPTGQT